MHTPDTADPDRDRPHPLQARTAARTARGHGRLLLGTGIMVLLGVLVSAGGFAPTLRRWRAAAELERLADAAVAWRVALDGTRYLELPETRDPWGSPYQIRSVDGARPGRICVLSLGPDRREGTADDIRRELQVDATGR